MDLVDRLNNTGFLGKEFLTWLWYKSDSGEGLIDIGDGRGAAEVWFTSRIVLSGAGQGADRVSVKTEEPSASIEARTALREGKKVDQASLRIVRDQREWTATIKGEALAIGGAKIPAVLTKDEDDRQRERFALVDQLDAMVASLYAAFVALRIEPAAWASEVTAMRAWLDLPASADVG